MRRMYILLAITALCLLDKPAVATPPAGDPPVTFRSDVSLGRVDAQVVDGENHPIRGLKPQDFILRVDGKSQEIRHFQSDRMPVDVVLLLDVSRSMEPHIRRVASASHQALRALGDQDRIATMVFDRLTRLRMPFQLQPSGCRAEHSKACSIAKLSRAAPISRGGCWTPPLTSRRTRDAMHAGQLSSLPTIRPSAAETKLRSCVR